MNANLSEYESAWNAGDPDAVQELTGTIDLLDPATHNQLPDQPARAETQPVRTPERASTESAQPLPTIGAQTTPFARALINARQVAADAQDDYKQAFRDMGRSSPDVDRLWKAIQEDAANPASDTQFGEAFRNARKAGLEQFTWRGKPYHTRTREEEQRAAARKPKPATPATRQPTGDLRDPFNPERLFMDQRTKPTEPRKPRRTQEGNPKRADPTPAPKPRKADTADGPLSREEIDRRKQEYAAAWRRDYEAEKAANAPPELSLMEQAKRFLGLQ